MEATAIGKINNCNVSTEPRILVCIKAMFGDGEDTWEVYNLNYSQDTLNYLRVILYLYNHGFETSHWRDRNPFKKYGLSAYGDEYDWEDAYNDYDCDEHSNDPVFMLEKAKLMLIGEYMGMNSPLGPNDTYGCHSIKEFDVYVITPECSGILVSDDVTDDEILAEHHKRYK